MDFKKTDNIFIKFGIFHGILLKKKPRISNSDKIYNAQIASITLQLPVLVFSLSKLKNNNLNK